MSVPTVTTHYVPLSNATVFYRTAGSSSNPTVLLLHGFPSSSHMFRNMIPTLAKKYHVVAPDYPGFGFTTAAPDYTYTFANLATTLGEFLDELKIETFAMYIFDYGAPIGLRLALERPNAVKALVTQNGNAYVEGFGEMFGPIINYWRSGSKDDREKLREGMLSLKTTRLQYELGTPHPETIAPESWTLDFAMISRNQEVQLDLFKDYESNVPLYPKFHEWFAQSQIPVLACWGKNDLIFIPPGAEAFKKDLPSAEIVFLDAGHFAGETNSQEIGNLMLKFFEKNSY